MSRIEKRVVVDCSLERLFTYVPEAADTAELWPGLLEVGEVQRLPLGGVLARWIYKMTGVLFEDLDERCEPLVNRDHSPASLGNIECTLKWNFQANAYTPALLLDGDHSYWSMC